IVVDYALEGGITGKVTVPFTNTDESGNETAVNIVRNNLYRVVLGDGDPIRPGADVEVKIIDEPWEVIDLPVVVGKPEQGETLSEQAIANAALNVSKFARTPVADKFPDGCGFMDAVLSNLLMFADDSVGPYDFASTNADFNSAFTTSWTTRVNGGLYRLPTFKELIDLLPPVAGARLLDAHNDFNVYELGLDPLYSITGQETYHVTIIPKHSNDDNQWPIYILSGLVDKSDNGGSVRDSSGEQAKIHKMSYDPDRQMFTMDVMALKTIDLSQVIGFMESGHLSDLNMSNLSDIFDAEDKLTFNFKNISQSEHNGETVYFRTLSSSLEPQSYVAFFKYNGMYPNIYGDIMSSSSSVNWTCSLMLIKAD
ncbi:MAG: hypothetical protein K2O56_09275, partial [Muribaculaceae bacterium]|nr:hypothetical protein [Muribaculaceae bacterium]